MSRCFPFPPPGYERAITANDNESLKKEKRKEKKHKKDKKDKEKREGREKKEKDRSDGKHKEKKDWKEKHREKKKDKEKEKDKAKGSSSNSDEKSVGELFEGSNGEKLGQKAEPVRDKSSCSDDRKSAVQFEGRNGEMPLHNIKLAVDAEAAKFVEEFSRRIRDDEKGSGSNHFAIRSNHFGEESTVMDERIDRFAVKDVGMVADSKNSNIRIESRKMDGQRIRDETCVVGNTVAPNSTGSVENKIEGKMVPLDKKIREKEKSREREGNDKRREKRKSKDKDKKSHGKDKDRDKEKKEEKAKEKSEHKRSEKEKSRHINQSDPLVAVNEMSLHPSKDRIQNADSEGNLRKRKEMETNGFMHDNDPRPKKIPKPNSHISTENGRALEGSQNPGMFLSDRQGASANHFKVENKEFKLNGCITAQSASVSTIIKPLPPSTANHNAPKLLPISTVKPLPANANQNRVIPLPLSPPKPNQIVTQLLPVHAPAKPAKQLALHLPPDNSKHLNKIHPIPKTEPPVPDTKHVSQKISLPKTPHPDTKYLSQILSIPKMEPWSDFDDQGWLFTSKRPTLKKEKEEMEFECDKKEHQVWAEAMHIESVDICALPYVIPY